jgi:hypothetical protein
MLPLPDALWAVCLIVLCSWVVSDTILSLIPTYEAVMLVRRIIAPTQHHLSSVFINNYAATQYAFQDPGTE